ncbi:MAG TPA: hypothetical protein VEZ72_19560, partial [Paenibacillus sp.]|nr:hypothetical protein [Paenibacillus sp.]
MSGGGGYGGGGYGGGSDGGDKAPARKSMSVRRRLFLAMASMIVGMALVFSFISHVVQADVLTVMVEAPRKERVGALSSAFEAAYARSGGSWGAVADGTAVPPEAKPPLLGEERTVLLTTPSKRPLYAVGP